MRFGLGQPKEQDNLLVDEGGSMGVMQGPAEQPGGGLPYPVEPQAPASAVQPFSEMRGPMTPEEEAQRQYSLDVMAADLGIGAPPPISEDQANALAASVEAQSLGPGLTGEEAAIERQSSLDARNITAGVGRGAAGIYVTDPASGEAVFIGRHYLTPEAIGARAEGSGGGFRFGVSGTLRPPVPKPILDAIREAEQMAERAQASMTGAQAAQLLGQVEAYDGALAHLEDIAQRHQDLAAAVESESRQQMHTFGRMLSGLAATRISPDRFFQSRGEGSRFLASIAQGMSLLAQAANPGIEPAAVHIIENAIDRDVQAQVENVGIQQAALQGQATLFSQLQAHFGNQQSALEAYRALRLEQARVQMERLAMQWGIPQLIARYQTIAAHMRGQTAQSMAQLFQRQMEFNYQIRAGTSPQQLMRALTSMRGQWDRLFGEAPPQVRQRAAGRAQVRRMRLQANPETGEVAPTAADAQGVPPGFPGDWAGPLARQRATDIMRETGSGAIAVDERGNVTRINNPAGLERIPEEAAQRLSMAEPRPIGSPDSTLGVWVIDPVRAQHLRPEDVMSIEDKYAIHEDILATLQELRGLGASGVWTGDAGRASALRWHALIQEAVATGQGAISDGDAERLAAQVPDAAGVLHYDHAAAMAAIDQTVRNVERRFASYMAARGARQARAPRGELQAE